MDEVYSTDNGFITYQYVTNGLIFYFYFLFCSNFRINFKNNIFPKLKNWRMRCTWALTLGWREENESSSTPKRDFDIVFSNISYIRFLCKEEIPIVIKSQLKWIFSWSVTNFKFVVLKKARENKIKFKQC